MVSSVEFMITPKISTIGGPMLEALANAAGAAGVQVTRSRSYRGGSDWLMLYGVGAEECSRARDAQVKGGGAAVIWDLGYFGRKKTVGFLRASVNVDHPHSLLDATPKDASRWDAQGILLREDRDPSGPIILVGFGRKSRAYLGERVHDWEKNKLLELELRYPGKEIIFRPKPRNPFPRLKCKIDDATPIVKLLKGASLVVCRHSNVAVDAAIAGVPFETEDGAALWLAQRPFTRENRLEFLQRLSWWQWKAEEAREAWRFLNKVIH